MDLMKLLPDIYEDNNTMKILQKNLSENINNLSKSLNETIDQGFISSATNLLSRYEKIYGLEVDISKSNDFRRERIKAKLRGQGTTTKELIKNVVSSFSNGDVEVIEDSANYTFKIKFVGVKGIPSNMADLILTIEEIKPAHLSFSFEYSYNTWSDIKKSTWQNIKIDTWQNLKVR